MTCPILLHKVRLSKDGEILQKRKNMRYRIGRLPGDLMLPGWLVTRLVEPLSDVES